MNITIYRVSSGFSNYSDRLFTVQPEGEVNWDAEDYVLPDGVEVDFTLPYTNEFVATNGDTYAVWDEGLGVCIKKEESEVRHPLIYLHKAEKPTRKTIASLRAAIGVTQAELAEASGVNIRQIQRVESGESTFANLTAKNALAIADVLKVNPRDLI